MDKLDTYIKKHGVEYSNALIEKKDISHIEKEIGVKMGLCLIEYLLRYGYLMFNYVELYGVTARQWLESDLVKQTVYLHRYFKQTEGLIAIENQGEGDYYLVDSQDNVYEFDSELKKLTKTGKCLEDYIISRFEESR